MYPAHSHRTSLRTTSRLTSHVAAHHMSQSAQPPAPAGKERRSQEADRSLEGVSERLREAAVVERGGLGEVPELPAGLRVLAGPGAARSAVGQATEGPLLVQLACVARLGHLRGMPSRLRYALQGPAQLNPPAVGRYAEQSKERQADDRIMSRRVVVTRWALTQPLCKRVDSMQPVQTLSALTSA